MTIFHKSTGSFPSHRVQRYRQLAMMVCLLVALGALVQADERIIRVARISLIEGEVSYQRANDSRKDWFDATPNLPLDESDQLYTGLDGRAEIQLSGRNIVRINHNTNLRFTQFNTSTIQLALATGTATFRIDSLDRRQFHVLDASDGNLDDPVYFEVDTPTVAITLLKEGNYRVNVHEDGTTEVIVRRGQAEVYNKELGTVVVKQGRRFVIEGRDSENFQIARLEDKDGWDRWNDRRDDELFARTDTSQSARHIPRTIAGVYDLDLHGEWLETPEYGWVWTPRATPADWAPYRQGYWCWYPSYGWTWVSYEPWGWVPYHYGRWAYWRSRWCWVPSVGFGIGIGHGWNWAPHLVVFFGWGGGYRRGYRDGYFDGYRDGRSNWYGWCPLGPGEGYYGRTTVVNKTTIINNAPRSIQSLRNYAAPGGMSRMDSRRFDQRRVVVANNVMTAPPRGGPRNEPATPMLVSGDEIKPTQTGPARTAIVDRAEAARKLELPVVMRRTAPNPTNPARSLDGDASSGSRVVRDGVVIPPTPSRNSTTTGSDSTSSTNRVNNGQIQRSDRPARYTDYRPVERVEPPVRRSPDETRSPGGRSDSPRETGGSPGDNSTPNRNLERPSRNDSPTNNPSAPRRVDPPSRPPVEQRETPRYEPRESAPPRENRRPDPPPARESTPSRHVERPSSPPSSPPPSPPRESAPPRNTDRPSSPPSSPPARESAPAKSPERSMPSRKTEPY